VKWLVRVDEAAREEIAAAVGWYDAQTAQPTLGDDLLAALDDVLLAVAERPESFPSVSGVPERIGARAAPAGRFPFRVVFVLLADHVRVLAFVHHRRRPGYWRSRI
jgi:hypothetical protein